jgi:hypothetical protein
MILQLNIWQIDLETMSYEKFSKIEMSIETVALQIMIRRCLDAFKLHCRDPVLIRQN